jgi:5-methylcytosine-specific restriction endonuclease McrA
MYNPDWVRTCTWCEEEFYLPDSQLKENQTKTFCCEECNSAWKRSEENRGENHHNWTGGNYDKSRIDAPEHRHWRHDLLERDDHTCQHCGATEETLHAHHIVAYSVDKSLEHVRANGVVLCEGCHNWVHRTENCGLKCDSADFLLKEEVITSGQYERLNNHR